MAIFIGAGGTGQEIALSLIRLSYLTSSQLPNIVIIDSDVARNDGDRANRYATRKQILDSLQSKFLALRIVATEFSETINPADLSIGDTDPSAAISVDTISDIFRRGKAGVNADDDKILDLLLTPDQRTSRIDDGFHGQPALGSLVVRAAIKSGAWKQFLDSIAKKAGQSKGLRIVAAGSVTGGVGTAVLPSLISELKALGDQANGATIHGLIQLPWFELEQTTHDTTSRPPDVDLAMMERNTACLTKGYLEKLLTEKLDSAVFIGLPQLVSRTSQGGSLQRETLHYLNIVSGLVALRMLDQDAWTYRGVQSLSIGDTGNTHLNGAPEGPSYKDFSLRRIASISRSLVALSEALVFEVEKSDPTLTHRDDLASLLRRQNSRQRDEFIASVRGFHELHLDIWQWFTSSLESLVGGRRADTFEAFAPEEGWQDFRRARTQEALRVTGSKLLWPSLGRRLLQRLGPFAIPNDAVGAAAARSIVFQARDRLIQLTGNTREQ